MIKYLSRSDIGAWFGVSDHAVAQWQRRFPVGSKHPFPEPEAVTGKKRPVPGWLPNQEGAIREWDRTR